MPTKGSGCCCHECWFRGECSPDATHDSYSYQRGRCCRCFPRQLCATLTLPEYCEGQGDDTEDVADRTVGVTLYLDEETYSYSGTFQVLGLGNLSFSLYFLKEIGTTTHACWAAFDCPSLGLTGENIARVPLGGEYQDLEQKIADCEAFEFEFDINLSAAFPTCGGAATVAFAPAPMSRVERCCHNSCVHRRVCLTYDSGYGDAEMARVCIEVDGSDSLWQHTFTDPLTGELVEIKVYLDSFENDQPVLRVEAPTLGEPLEYNPVDADCPTMAASWTFYGGETVTVRGDPRGHLCGNCKCICTDICVTLIEDALLAHPAPKAFVGAASYDDAYACEGETEGALGEWEVTLVDVEGVEADRSVRLWLQCDCDGKTRLYCEGVDEGIEIDCPAIADIANPELKQVAFAVNPGGGAQSYTVYVSCSGCQPCRMRVAAVPCCPDRVGAFSLPAILHMEVTSTNADCECLLGATGTLIWNGDTIVPEWSGHLSSPGLPGCEPYDGSFPFTLRCGGNGVGDWELEGCGTFTNQDGTCDPFSLDFLGGGGCAMCEENATAEFTVTISE